MSALIVIGGALLFICWRYARSRLLSPRIMPFLAAFTGFFVAFGFPTLLYAAAGSAATDTGMGVLLGLDAFGIGVILFEVFLAHRYHPVMTPFFAGAAGFAFAVTRADWPQVHAYIHHLPRKVGKAMGKEIHHIQHTHPATGTAAHQQHTLLILAVIGFFAAAWVVKRRYNRRVQSQGEPVHAVPRPALAKGLGVGGFFQKLGNLRGAHGRGFQSIGPGGAPIDDSGGRGGGSRRGGAVPIGRN